MSDRTIVTLPETTTLANNDILLVVTSQTISNSSVTTTLSTQNRKITVENFSKAIHEDNLKLPVYANNTAVLAVSGPETGFLAYTEDPEQIVLYDGSDWVVYATPGSTLT